MARRSVVAALCSTLFALVVVALAPVTSEAERSEPTAEAARVGLSEVRRLSVGGGHTCVVERDDTGKCWGRNSWGELGDASTDFVNAPVRIADAHEWRVIAAGRAGTCGIDVDGALWCWGYIPWEERARHRPIRVGDSNAWTSLDQGGSVGCGIRRDHSAWCWGNPGSLGSGPDQTLAATPVEVAGGADWRVVEASRDHACGIRVSGSLWCWGDNTRGQLGDGTTQHRDRPVRVGFASDWVAVSALEDTTCGIREGKGIWCWGSNGAGQVGDGTTVRRTSPVKVLGGVATAVAAGQHHACALREGGEIWCWGRGPDGELGARRSALEPYRAVAGTWRAIGVGWSHSCGLRAGAAFCWGLNDRAQVADRTATDRSIPTQVGAQAGSVHSWTAPAGGESHACGIADGDELWCWGNLYRGAVGPPTSIGRWQPVLVSRASWRTVSADVVTTCAIRQKGSLWCSGWYPGNGRKESSRFVRAGQADDWTQVEVGGYGGGLRCGIRSRGSLWCWGRNDVGSVGDGTTRARFVPVRVASPGRWRTVDVSGLHACGIKRRGALFCWGANPYGQVGDGTTEHRSRPRRVGTARWRAVATAGHTSCGVRESGSLWCWGRQWYVVPDGDGTKPLRVGRASNWVAVTAGHYHACAMKTDGSAWCWGSNDERIGDGEGSGYRLKAPHEVLGDITFTEIDAGWFHTCGTTAAGRMYCWGYNDSGQLALGRSGGSSRPRLVPPS